jgi:hypothetical protein
VRPARFRLQAALVPLSAASIYLGVAVVNPFKAFGAEIAFVERALGLVERVQIGQAKHRGKTIHRTIHCRPLEKESATRRFNLLSVPGSRFQTETKGFPSGGKERPSRGPTRGDVTVLMRTISEQKVGRADVALGWSSRIMGLTRVLGGILFFALLPNPVEAGQSVTLAWNSSPDTNVAGYNVYYGVASRSYTNMVNVGNSTNATISGLVEGATYYFAATAYNLLGLESDFSDEASYSAPLAIARLQIRAAPAGQFVLTVTGPIGHTYEILATQTFTAWTVIGAVTMPAGGSLNFTDTNAASFPKRFYRTRE